ncbi:hypothetical protein EI77_04627 [Prosthecobacter fusiformis]|uniref:Uncharacterized protein n=1 Tax=Prosthecobacter fusiformis TaxID=48464 RepID=A0A4R7RJQ0_9BACT|nr:hypothetical protein [Prosthecobacter fusiformis]TDU62526.1 hypothetical protein EI77_04627 [Prosthecobacter fusiformis]
MSTSPSPASSSPGDPFVIGRHYRVRRTFKALRDHFTEGELLIFDSRAWSRYDGMTGFFFSQPGRENIRAWDIGDYEDLSIWTELFEELPDQKSTK